MTSWLGRFAPGRHTRRSLLAPPSSPEGALEEAEVDITQAPEPSPPRPASEIDPVVGDREIDITRAPDEDEASGGELDDDSSWVRG